MAVELSKNVRTSDLVSRMGGEEFAILMPETTPQKAQEIAQKICKNVERLVILEMDEGNSNLTVSIGVATCELIPEGVGKALIKADEALYRAKNNGRNQVQTND